MGRLAFIFVFLFLLIGLVITAYYGLWYLPPVASFHGKAIDKAIYFILWVTVFFWIAGHIGLGYLLWKYGRAQSVTFRLPTPKKELILCLFPALLMALAAEGGASFLAQRAWYQVMIQPAPQHAFNVEVTGQQFMWVFRYPGPDGKFGKTNPKKVRSPDNYLGLDYKDPAARDDIVTTQLTLPIHQPVHLRIRSLDVLHSFFIPAFRIKQDAVPGMTIELSFTPTKMGTFEIACAQLCGLGHYRMRSTVEVVSPEDFKRRYASRFH